MTVVPLALVLIYNNIIVSSRSTCSIDRESIIYRDIHTYRGGTRGNENSYFEIVVTYNNLICKYIKSDIPNF